LPGHYGARDHPAGDHAHEWRCLTPCELSAIAIVFGFAGWLMLHEVALYRAIEASLGLFGGAVVVLRVGKPLATLVRMVRTLPPLQPSTADMGGDTVR
jgi:hypothetical protein